MPATLDGPVLIVDDETEVRFLLESLLTDQGYPVRTASNGQEALEVIAQELPALLLLDLHMPVLSGWETFAALRARERSFPVVFMTGGINAAIQASAHQADGYLVKPFNLEVVLETVGSFVPAPEPPRVEPARVAILGFPDDLAEKLADIVLEAGGVPLATPFGAHSDTPAALQEFLDHHHAAVVLYNVGAPYPESWARFATVRAAEHSAGTGRRLVALTCDKEALQAHVGPTPAIALDEAHLDAATLRENLHELALV